MEIDHFMFSSNIQVEPIETLNTAMDSLKAKGFINYYGLLLFFKFSYAYLFDLFLRYATIWNRFYSTLR